MVILSAVSINEVDCSKFLLRFQFRDRCYRDNAGLNLYEGIFVCVCNVCMHGHVLSYWIDLWQRARAFKAKGLIWRNDSEEGEYGGGVSSCFDNPTWPLWVRVF